MDDQFNPLRQFLDLEETEEEEDEQEDDDDNYIPKYSKHHPCAQNKP